MICTKILFVYIMLDSIESSFSSSTTTFTDNGTARFSPAYEIPFPLFQSTQDETSPVSGYTSEELSASLSIREKRCTTSAPNGIKSPSIESTDEVTIATPSIPAEMRSIFTSKSPTWSPTEVPTAFPQGKRPRSSEAPTAAPTTSSELPTTLLLSTKRNDQRKRHSLGSNSPTYSPENYPILTTTGLPIAYPAAQTRPKRSNDARKPSRDAEVRTTIQRTRSASTHKSPTYVPSNMPSELPNLRKSPSAAPQGSRVSSNSLEMPVIAATKPSLVSKSPSYMPSDLPVMEVSQSGEERYQLINSKNSSWASAEQNMTGRSSTIISSALTQVQTQFLVSHKQ